MLRATTILQTAVVVGGGGGRDYFLFCLAYFTASDFYGPRSKEAAAATEQEQTKFDDLRRGITEDLHRLTKF